VLTAAAAMAGEAKIAAAALEDLHTCHELQHGRHPFARHVELLDDRC
jgi:hypothetical protein